MIRVRQHSTVNQPRQGFLASKVLPAVAGLSACLMLGQVYAQAARDQISVVGSSTVYPFATVVAERFGRSTNFKTPTIEPTGSGGGFRLFCAGVGRQYADITNSSRRIRRSELNDCEKNGVTEIIEVMIGYDGIVVANTRETQRFALTIEDLFLALAKRVPDPNGSGALVSNPYRTWSQINSSLPATRIEVLGPPPTSGTRDAFLELVMEPACKTFDAYSVLEGEDYDVACLTLREDFGFTPAGENDNLIVQKLLANPTALGIFGFSFLDQNSDQIHGASINGIEPEFDSISDGSYPISRPLFFYAKAAHADVIPGIREYLREFTSESAAGEFGYLSDRGLIPLAEEDRQQVAADVNALKTLDPADLD